VRASGHELAANNEGYLTWIVLLAIVGAHPMSQLLLHLHGGLGTGEIHDSHMQPAT